MEHIFKKVKIVDPGGKYHHKICDVLVIDGLIADVATEIKSSKNSIVHQRQGSFLSPGWTDLGATVGEPGYEHRETLESLSQAAVAGGYTRVLVFPNTSPCIQSKSEIHFILNQSAALPIHVLPLGAVSKQCQGAEMAEILQMHDAGAIAFSDGKKPIQDSGLLMRALEYMKLIPNSILINQSFDKAIAGQGQIDEGKMSTLLGLKGIPALAETTHIHRDISLLQYSDSRLLIHKVSCADSVQAIRQAKKTTSDLFASVSIFNLLYDADALSGFDIHLKLDPPLRSDKDRKALVKALKDGVIDCIVSDHTPWDPENKELEFQSSAFGSLSLQTCFMAYCTYLMNELDLDLWVEKLVKSYHRMFHVPESKIAIGNLAELTWFETSSERIFTEKDIRSISKNSPFIGKKLKGSVLGTYCKGNFSTDLIESH